jgi:hypothetical protein
MGYYEEPPDAPARDVILFVLGLFAVGMLASMLPAVGAVLLILGAGYYIATH